METVFYSWWIFYRIIYMEFCWIVQNLRNFSCYQEEADTYAAEDENIDVDLCLDAAVNQLKYVIVYDCGSFGTCRNRSEVEIKTIIKELIQYIKVSKYFFNLLLFSI